MKADVLRSQIETKNLKLINFDHVEAKKAIEVFSLGHPVYMFIYVNACVYPVYVSERLKFGKEM